MTVDDLKRYAAAWNAHDVDAIMAMMTEDCVFETGGGSERWGTRFEGADTVRKRFAVVWHDVPDARWDDAEHIVDGDRGCSTWTFRGTTANGQTLEIEGCDLFTFRDGAIHRKSTFLKQRRNEQSRASAT